MSNVLVRRFKENVNALRQVTYGRLLKKYVANAFHKLYWGNSSQTWYNTFWLGFPVEKCPLDLWVYQEIIFKLKPDVIIECGTGNGGGALFMAHILDILNSGTVISIDIQQSEGRPQHKRIRYLLGSSTSEDILAQVSGLKGSYLIVEDTNINGHPVLPEFGPGPMEAVSQFLSENKDFIVDKTKEKFYMTQNPNGYLIKISGL